MLPKLDRLELAQLPGLVYQLLLLADSLSKPSVLLALNAHFESLFSKCREEATLSQRTGDRMNTLPHSYSLDQLHHIQGTVVLHVQFAAKQDQALGSAVLKLVKSGEMPLGGFSLALLLVLSRISRFEETAIACIVDSFQHDLRVREWCSTSPWLTTVVRSLPKLEPELLLTAAVESSAAAGYEQGVQSLVRLATALVDTKLPEANDNFAAATLAAMNSAADCSMTSIVANERLPVTTRSVLLGQHTLLELFRQHSQVRGDVLDAVIHRMVSRAPSLQQWVSFLQLLVQSQPLMVLDHIARLKQLLEYILHVPSAVASPLLKVLLPLLEQRLELRDHLVLLLRKAMFNRDEEMRLTAVHGFLLLLHASSACDATGSISSDANLQFQLEVLGFIRRSLTQQAAILRTLYQGLPLIFERLPKMRDMIAELLYDQLRQYLIDGGAEDVEEDGVELPFQLAKCLRFVGDESKPTIVEPLPQLLQAITHCVRCALLAGDSGLSQGSAPVSPALGQLEQCMGTIVKRLGKCGIDSLGFGHKNDLSQLTHSGRYNMASAALLLATLEALVDWCILVDFSDECYGPSTACTSDAREETLAVKRTFSMVHALHALIEDNSKGKRASSPLDCQFTISLESIECALRAIRTRGPASKGEGCHFERFVLKCCHNRSLQLRGKAVRDKADLRIAASCARVLLDLAPLCEAIVGKEAPSGRRADIAGGKESKGKCKEKEGKEKEKKNRSRLLLLLEALEPIIGILCQQVDLRLLGFSLGLDERTDPAEVLPESSGDLSFVQSVKAGLQTRLLELVYRLAVDDSDKEAEVSLRIALGITKALPMDALYDALAWSRNACKMLEVGSAPLARGLLSFSLTLEGRLHEQPSVSLHLAQLLHSNLGDNLNEQDDPVGESQLEPMLLISEANSNSLVPALLESIASEMDGCDRAFALCKMGGARSRNDAKRRELEESVLERTLRHVAILRTLCKSQLENGPAQALLRTCLRLFKQLQGIFRAPSLPLPLEPSKLTQLLTDVSGDLSTSMYGEPSPSLQE